MRNAFKKKRDRTTTLPDAAVPEWANVAIDLADCGHDNLVDGRSLRTHPVVTGMKASIHIYGTYARHSIYIYYTCTLYYRVSSNSSSTLNAIRS